MLLAVRSALPTAFNAVSGTWATMLTSIPTASRRATIVEFALNSGPSHHPSSKSAEPSSSAMAGAAAVRRKSCAARHAARIPEGEVSASAEKTGNSAAMRLADIIQPWGITSYGVT